MTLLVRYDAGDPRDGGQAAGGARTVSSRWRALPLAAAFACVLAGCNDSTSPPSGSNGDPLAALLVVPPPAGYVTNTAATGPLDLNAARQSTPADPDQLGTELGRNGFDHGYARVWVNGGDFVTDEVLRLHTTAQARTIVEVERQALADAQGFDATSDTTLPGSVVYTSFSSTRQGGHDVFCQGVWFPMAHDVFGVTTCSTLPAGATGVEQLAETQYAAAASAEGVPPLPAPSATP
jgi:hypothetical protein